MNVVVFFMRNHVIFWSNKKKPFGIRKFTESDRQKCLLCGTLCHLKKVPI